MHKLTVYKIPKLGSSAQYQKEVFPALPRGVVSAVHPKNTDQSVYFSVLEQEVGLLNLTDGKRSGQLSINCHQDPLIPGAISVHPNGDKVLLMAKDTRYTDSRLVEINLDSQTQQIVYRQEGPGWLLGIHHGNEIIILEQTLGDSPQFTVRYKNKALWQVHGTQPLVAPAVWQDNYVLLIACPEPNPLTGTGPTQLCALDLNQGTLFPICEAQGESITVDEETVSVESYSHIFKYQLTLSET